MAFETMTQYIKNPFDQFHNLDFLEINRQGLNWYNRFNFSWKIKEKFHIHFSGGITYAQTLGIWNEDTTNLKGGNFDGQIQPDASLGLDYRFQRWITFHSTYSYGSTFLYSDNIARKQQFSLTTRIAPFVKSKHGILSCFTFELAYLHNYYRDADQSFSGPIGFFYWQWDWSKENRMRRKKQVESDQIKPE